MKTISAEDAKTALRFLDPNHLATTDIFHLSNEMAAASVLRMFIEQNQRLTPAAQDVLTERRRQIESEGWTAESDDKHEYGQMALAAAAYAAAASDQGQQGDVFITRCNTQVRAGWFNLPALLWPWDRGWWKPGTPPDRRRMVVKAAALLLAEIERLDRAEEAKA